MTTRLGSGVGCAVVREQVIGGRHEGAETRKHAANYEPVYILGELGRISDVSVAVL